MKYTRYLLWNFIKVFLLMLLAWVFVFVIIDFVGNIRTWLARDTQDAINYYLNYLPNIIYLISPVAIMLTTMAVLGGMSKHLELTAMISSGRSISLILLPLFVVGLILTGGGWYLNEEILPDANHERLQLMQPRSSKQKNKRRSDKTQFIYIGENKETIYFRHYSGKSKQGRDVIILLFDDGKISERYDAQRMKWREDNGKGYWRLYSGVHRKFINGSISATKFKRNNLNSNLKVKPNELLNNRYTADEMNIAQIKERIAVLRRTGESTAAMETQLHFKYSGSIIYFLFVVIGSSLSHRYNRVSGLSKQFGVGLLVIFSYFVVVRFGLQMGEVGALSPFMGAWVGNIIFGIIALITFIRSLRL